MAAVNTPYTIALTGGIAAGKTLVSNAFIKLAIPVIDTDIIAREIVAPGLPALLEIASVFGETILDEHGQLKRRHLRERVFADPDARKKLEAILHPKIREVVNTRVANIEHDFCILVIPLLAEHDAYPNIDRVLVIDVDVETQISRLMARDKSSRQLAEQILAAQASRKQRLSIADDVLDNSGSPGETQIAVEKLATLYTRLARERKPAN